MSISKTSNSSTALDRQDTDSYIKDADKDFQKVFNRLNKTPNITTGTAVPTTTPSRIGNIYVDTTNSKVYISKGHSSSGDWLVLN